MIERLSGTIRYQLSVISYQLSGIRYWINGYLLILNKRITGSTSRQ